MRSSDPTIAGTARGWPLRLAAVVFAVLFTTVPAPAQDLGVIRARVCDPASLLLSNRHAGVRAAAELEHRKRWSAEENEPEE